MASTILYKFRSGTSFEPLPLPGTSARLFDIKRAIVKAKGLDGGTGGSMEFDLSIENATTNEVYDDEQMILPRGTRIVVRRVAAERGRGILSRIASQGMGGGNNMGGRGGAAAGIGGAAAKDFYTIRSNDREEEDEFLDTNAAVPAPSAVYPPPPATNSEVDETKELEALMAVTNQSAASMTSSTGGMNRPRDPRLAGQGMPPQFAKPPPKFNTFANRPNADPELRQQEMLMAMGAGGAQVKKRATGIPRTFLTLGNTNNTEGGDAVGGEGGGEGEEIKGSLDGKLQPSAQAFQALVKMGGGQSLSSTSGRRDLDYALKLTATSVPEHLQCGICSKIVTNAMLVPWDPEGRPVHESCIRDGLMRNGFTCPLTGQEGVSPDDLFPNVGLRKAVDAFVKDVMGKMDAIEKQIEAEQEVEERKRIAAVAERGKLVSGNDFDDDKDGIMMGGKRGKGVNKKRKSDNNDLLLGGDDDFGGDVFDVTVDEDDEEAAEDLDETVTATGTMAIDDNAKTEMTGPTKDGRGYDGANVNEQTNNENNVHKSDHPGEDDDISSATRDTSKNGDDVASLTSSVARRKDVPKRRGPPAGYVLGPAGGGIINTPPPNMIPQFPLPPPPPPPPLLARAGGGPAPFQGDMGRGRGGTGGRFPSNQFGGRDGGRFHPNHHQQQQQPHFHHPQQPPPYPLHNGGGRGGHDMPPNGRGGGFNQQWVSAVVLSLVPSLVPLYAENTWHLESMPNLVNRISCFIYK